MLLLTKELGPGLETLSLWQKNEEAQRVLLKPSCPPQYKNYTPLSDLTQFNVCANRKQVLHTYYTREHDQSQPH